MTKCFANFPNIFLLYMRLHINCLILIKYYTTLYGCIHIVSNNNCIKKKRRCYYLFYILKQMFIMSWLTMQLLDLLLLGLWRVYK